LKAELSPEVFYIIVVVPAQGKQAKRRQNMANEFKIEDNVLLGCRKSAVKVTIPDGVERLDDRAF
jgi:preprotein translocase subunit YajC